MYLTNYDLLKYGDTYLTAYVLSHDDFIPLDLIFRLYGNYENLMSGSTTRSLQDLTGGIVQSFGLSHQDRYLTFQVLNSAVPRSSLLIATITPVLHLSLRYKRCHVYILC